MSTSELKYDCNDNNNEEAIDYYSVSVDQSSPSLMMGGSTNNHLLNNNFKNNEIKAFLYKDLKTELKNGDNTKNNDDETNNDFHRVYQYDNINYKKWVIVKYN